MFPFNATRSSISVIFLFLLLAEPLPTAAAGENNDDKDSSSCPLWIAPSNTDITAKENKKFTKYGLYAGRTYTQNSTLPFSELAIPLIDFFGDYNRQTRMGEEILAFMEDNLWTPEFIGSHFEGNISAPAIIPGTGLLANYHTGYSNANFLQAAIFLREAMLSSTPTAVNDDDIDGDAGPFPRMGQAHLMRGAVTPYYNATLKATQDIPAGMEIFADFGDIWDGNFTENVYHDKIHRYDYEIADKLVNGLVKFYEEFPNLSIAMQEDIMDFMLDKVLGIATGAYAKTIMSLIPANPRKLKKVQEAGGTFMYRYKDMVKSKKWLNENGFCLDAIRQGISAIPNAGRGAFATRDIKKGETITVTPMVHIVDKKIMTMYPIKKVEDKESGATIERYDFAKGPIGKQLLLNYAFGHPESSLLLIPVGPLVTLINHAGKSANSFITWSNNINDVLQTSKSYLELSVEDLAEEHNIGIVMKVVARTDIKEGDEITLNYGPDWQKAWNQYEKEWRKSKEGKSHPLKADDLKVLYKSKPFETDKTLNSNPYPENVQVACFLVTQSRPDGTVMIHQTHGWEITDFKDPSSYDKYDGGSLYKVTILERKEAPGFFYNYTVIGHIGAETEEEVRDVPHSACTFVDSPYTSDIHIPGAFRHPIGIIDSHFPISWKNLR